MTLVHHPTAFPMHKNIQIMTTFHSWIHSIWNKFHNKDFNNKIIALTLSVSAVVQFTGGGGGGTSEINARLIRNVSLNDKEKFYHCYD